MTEEDEAFEQIEKAQGWRKREIAMKDDDDIQDYVRPWVGLTSEEILLISADCASSHQHTDIHFARAVEAKLKEKNT